MVEAAEAAQNWSHQRVDHACIMTSLPLEDQSIKESAGQEDGREESGEQSRAAQSTARCWIKERSDHTKNCQHVAASRRGKGQAREREREKQIASEYERERSKRGNEVSRDAENRNVNRCQWNRDRVGIGIAIGIKVLAEALWRLLRAQEKDEEDVDRTGN